MRAVRIVVCNYLTICDVSVPLTVQLPFNGDNLDAADYVIMTMAMMMMTTMMISGNDDNGDYASRKLTRVV